MSAALDVLIPTYNRSAALAITLTSLAMQEFHDFRVVVSDQTDLYDTAGVVELKSVIALLHEHGSPVEVHKHLPRRGMAEQRQFLLDQSQAPFALFLDDDLILEPYVVRNLLSAIQEEGCGFVGSAVIGLSFLQDERPWEQAIDFWDGAVQPERIFPDTPEWERYKLHNAANLYHVQQQLGLTPNRPRKYRVAWVGGCVLYDVAKLRSVGGFSFWEQLPEQHSGEDVLAQWRVMDYYGGCGLIPSGVYHQELPTTVPVREVDAPRILRLMDSGLVERQEL